MTEYHFAAAERSPGRSYLLEINPHYAIRGTEDQSNVIDARWIDTDTGLFIDISTVRKNWTAIEQGVEGALMCKDRHHYLVRNVRGVSSYPQKMPHLTGSLVAFPGKRHLPAPRQLLRGLSRQDPIRVCLVAGRRVWKEGAHAPAIRIVCPPTTSPARICLFRKATFFSFFGTGGLTSSCSHLWNQTSRLWEQMPFRQPRQTRKKPPPYPARGRPSR